MKRLAISVFSLFFFVSGLQAQMYVDGDTLYGNEWIDYSQSYRKAYISADGMYRIPYQTLAGSGVPVSSVSAENLQIFVNGEEIPIYTSTNNLASNGYIEFYGKKNKGDMDTHIYTTPEQLFNPYYSMFTDSSAYFLTWNNSTDNERFASTTNDLNNLPSPEPFFLHEAIDLPTPKYNKGVEYGEQYESTFSSGEGFGSTFSKDKTFTLSLENIYSSGSGARLEMNYASEDRAQHTTKLSVNGSSITLDNPNFSGYRLTRINQSLPTNLLSASTTVQLQGQAEADDKYATAFVKIKYPREFKFGNQNTFKFNLAASSSKQYLEISEFDTGGAAPILYDLTNGLRIVTNVSGNTVRVALPPSSNERELVLASQSAATDINGMLTVNFTDFVNTQGDFVILAHSKFMQGQNYVQQYADYRESTGYQPILIDIDELYDQFAYGISKHSISIRNFTGFSLENWTTTPPEYVFLIGKSRPYYSIRTNWNAQPAYTPTFGHEPSDNLLTATTTSDIPRIAIGRIPVTTADEVRIYLEKVKAFENNQNLPQTIEDKAWMKRVIHLGGGNPGIQTIIKDNLSDYERTIENDFYGADVSSFFKTSSDPIQISTSDLLDSLINDGASLITFYGHSSPNSFDFNLDKPENYQNQDRYPLILSLGCYSGQIHQKAKNLGEQFVFTEDKGAIAFIATVSLSGLPSLDVFADIFYDKLAKENYGEGIGDIVKNTIEQLSNSGADVRTRIVYQQMTLNGDPSIRLNTSLAPDYIVKKSSINFDPATPDANDDFDITFTVTNIGKSNPNQFRLLIERILPNGIEIPVVDEMVDSPTFEKEYTYSIQAAAQSIGLNKFRITVDADEEIAELPLTAEDNNTTVAELFIFTDDIEPVYPYDFSIIGSEDDLILKASTSNPFAEEFTYHIEVDTTELFNSPIKQATAVTQEGGLIEWKPSIPLMNETVYYWRVRVDPDQAPNALGWRSRSFVYIQDEQPGWNQSHYYQFEKDRFVNIKYPSRRFEFVDDNIEVIVKNAHVGVLLQNEIDYSVNGSRIYDVEGCEKDQQGMYIVLFDENLNPVNNFKQSGNQGLYGTYLCKPSAPAFLFLTDTPEGRLNLQSFLTGTLLNLSDVRYVLAYSLNDYQPQMWDQSLFNAFNARKFTEIPKTVGVPYAGMVDLQNNSTIDEDFGDDIDDIIEPTFTISGSWTEGKLISTVVGPASDWGSLHWDTSEEDADDNIVINVYGLTPTDERVELLTDITDRNYIFDGSIDATQYPRIQLEYDISDPTNATAPQLDFWRVVYDELPEIALRPDVFFSFESDTIRRGENLKMSIVVENIGKSDMDSLLMNYSIINKSNNNTIVYGDRLDPIAVGDTLIASLDVATKRFVGSNQLIIEANPNDDQPEGTHVNNIAIRSFFVEGDRLNPILDVTFDGQHILDGDIVSANPNIVISLRDENQYLELADTSLFKILMQYPGESSLRQISFDSDLITFYPAQRSSSGEEFTNKAVIELNPTLEQDGVYQLFVQAEDVSGNQSGDLDYKVSFEVVRNTGISNVLNYPNPFTTSTRFVFTLTGSNVPDYMKIQIMTVTGKVVREITRDELGDLHVGNNITDFAWDGTDQYGDQLANGVYLYRVVTKDNNGDEYARFQNNTNQYFKNGYGKMYLMR